MAFVKMCNRHFLVNGLQDAIIPLTSSGITSIKENVYSIIRRARIRSRALRNITTILCQAERRQESGQDGGGI